MSKPTSSLSSAPFRHSAFPVSRDDLGLFLSKKGLPEHDSVALRSSSCLWLPRGFCELSPYLSTAAVAFRTKNNIYSVLQLQKTVFLPKK
jgi:hypothetical protein